MELVNKIKMIAPELDTSKLSLRELEIILELFIIGINEETISNNISNLEILHALSSFIK